MARIMQTASAVHDTELEPTAIAMDETAHREAKTTVLSIFYVYSTLESERLPPQRTART